MTALKDKHYDYQVGMVDVTSGNVVSMSSGGSAIGAGADYLINAQSAFNDLLLSAHIMRGLHRLKPDIARIMPAKRRAVQRTGPFFEGAARGVMVIVNYFSTTDVNTGLIVKDFNSIYVLGAFISTWNALERWRNQPALVPTRDGWDWNQIYMWLEP